MDIAVSVYQTPETVQKLYFALWAHSKENWRASVLQEVVLFSRPVLQIHDIRSTQAADPAFMTQSLWGVYRQHFSDTEDIR